MKSGWEGSRFTPHFRSSGGKMIRNRLPSYIILFFHRREDQMRVTSPSPAQSFDWSCAARLRARRRSISDERVQFSYPPNHAHFLHSTSFGILHSPRMTLLLWNEIVCGCRMRFKLLNPNKITIELRLVSCFLVDEPRKVFNGLCSLCI